MIPNKEMEFYRVLAAWRFFLQKFSKQFIQTLYFFIQMDSILDLLSDERVFTVELSEPKTELRIKEACDNYFEVVLSKQELSRLIEELSAIRDEMV